MSEALRQALKVIDKHSISAIRTNSKDCGDWAEDMAYVGKVAREALAQPPAPTAQQCTCPSGDGSLRWPCPQHPANIAQPVQQPGAEPMQGGMDNAELLAAWKNKLPGVEPSDAQLTAFAVGVEVGFFHACDLERQDWSRVHHALAKHGAHPGRTDDHLADVIDRALAAPAQRQPVQQPGAEAVTLADVLDALNCFNRPKPNEDDGPWEGGHYIRVDHLPAFINVIAAAWFSPAQRQPLTVPALTDAQMSECAWGYVADSRNLDAGVTGIIQATQLACAAAWGITLAAQKGEKL